jgi:hypothetical protein
MYETEENDTSTANTTLPLSRSPWGNWPRDVLQVAYCIVGAVFHGNGGDMGKRNSENLK